MTTTVRADTPGHVIPILEDELADFTTEATEFLDGNRDALDFTKFRLRQGVYGQRQADRQMIRVKLPFGGVSSDQLDAFAEVAERFTPLRKGHLTTRENVQYHHVPLDETLELLQVLGRAGLSTARPAATPCATSPATPGPASATTSPSTSLPTRAPSCATSCAAS